MIDLDTSTSDLVIMSIDRPEKRNALNLEVIERLIEAFRKIGDDRGIRGIVLAGRGPSFCAGVDLHEFAAGSPQRAELLIGTLRELCATVRNVPQPVACAIHGHCLGGALELAMCCEFRVCTPEALLGMPEVFLGIPSVIDAVMLGHMVGTARAHELLLTGEPITGETAYAWGLVNRLAPAADLVQTARELLQLVTRHLPEVIRAQKRLHQEWLDLPYTQAVERSVEPLIDAFRAGYPQRIAAKRLERH